MSARRLASGVLAPSLAVLAAAAQAQPAASPLASCVAIADPMQRLACYDALAGRSSPPAAAAAPGAPSAVTAAPAAAGPPPAPPAAQATAVAPSTPGAPAAPPLSPQQAFGLYRAEHPASTELQSITARVTGMHTNARGRPVVDLDGGQSWELDAADPLLAPGDTVTIQRAALGSFILTTSTKRVHRAYRLN